MIELSVREGRGRDGPFHPAFFDAAMASEKALRIALAERAVQGAAPRRIKDALEVLCAFHMSDMEVSPAAKECGSVLHSWRKRTLVVTAFIQLDARWCKCGRIRLVQDALARVAACRSGTRTPAGFIGCADDDPKR